jgi:AAA domain
MTISGDKFDQSSRKIKKSTREAAEYLARTNGGETADFLDEAGRLENAKSNLFNDDDLKEQGFQVAAEYNYTDVNGKQLYQVVRYEHPAVKGAKRFRQRRRDRDGRWIANAGELKVPYLWPALAKKPGEVVWVTEGEKDAETLSQRGLVATTVAGQVWSPEAIEALRGRELNILEDNDQKGRENALNSERALCDVAESVRTVQLPGLAHKEDVTDWLDKRGGSIEELRKIADAQRKSGIYATATRWIDPRHVPPRRWLYKPSYIRQFLSLLLSTGGVGKSSLAIVEALAMVTGRPLLGVKPSRELRVWYWNGEDPLDELHRRFAAAQKHHHLGASDIGDRLFINSGRDMPIVLATEGARGAITVDEYTIQRMIAAIRRKKIDVLILDPFVALHRVNENNNSAIEGVAKSLSRLAELADCAVMLVHHTRKTREALTVDDGRGASALLAAARTARVLNSMDQKEADQAEIAERERRDYFRSDVGKANLVRSPEAADWFKLVSVDLENDPEQDFNEGDKVGVVTRYEYPRTETRTLTDSDIQRAQMAIAAGKNWRLDQRAGQWVGFPIAEALGFDLGNKGQRRQVVHLINILLLRGFLKRFEAKDAARRIKIYVKVGAAPDGRTGAPNGVKTS